MGQDQVGRIVWLVRRTIRGMQGRKGRGAVRCTVGTGRFLLSHHARVSGRCATGNRRFADAAKDAASTVIVVSSPTERRPQTAEVGAMRCPEAPDAAGWVLLLREREAQGASKLVDVGGCCGAR